jgi:hypothetical protein
MASQSVLTVNSLNPKYNLKAFIALITAKISLSVLFIAFNLYFPEAYLHIFSSNFDEYFWGLCLSIAPHPITDASVSIMK